MTLVICAFAVAATLGPQLDAVARLPGEPSMVSAAGMTKAEEPVLTIENGSAFDVGPRKRRVVIVGSGGDDRVADAVIAAVRWMKTNAPGDLRQQWVVSAMPATALDPTDPQSLTRWVTFQGP